MKKSILTLALILGLILLSPSVAAAADELYLDDDLDSVSDILKTNQSAYDKKHDTKTGKGQKDPFFPLVTKPVKPKPDPSPVRPVRPENETPRPVVKPPIKVNVICIIGNSGRRLALIEYKGRVKEYWEGDEEPGSFRIVEISNRDVTIYSLQKHRQRVFKLPD